MKNIKWLFITHLGRIVFGLTLMVVFGSLSNYGFLGLYIEHDPFTWVSSLGAAILVIETLIFIAHAWIINPIREYKEKKKVKKNKKNPRP